MSSKSTKPSCTENVPDKYRTRFFSDKQMARGYRNMDHFKIALFLHCGGLNLYPATHGKPNEPEFFSRFSSKLEVFQGESKAVP